VTVLERTQATSSRIEVRRIALTVLAAALWALGWLAGKTCSAVMWVAAAILIGWTDSRAPRRR
jgi:hypothetical protein